MADSPTDPPGPTGEQPCLPCRATGSVISNLGGSPQPVACPWCAGSGIRQPGIDAQALRVAEMASTNPAAGGDPPAPSS